MRVVDVFNRSAVSGALLKIAPAISRVYFVVTTLGTPIQGGEKTRCSSELTQYPGVHYSNPEDQTVRHHPDRCRRFCGITSLRGWHY